MRLVRLPTASYSKRLVAALRSERGYLATDYDASAGRLPETLRPQIGRSYDDKKFVTTQLQSEFGEDFAGLFV